MNDTSHTFICLFQPFENLQYVFEQLRQSLGEGRWARLWWQLKKGAHSQKPHLSSMDPEYRQQMDI